MAAAPPATGTTASSASLPLAFSLYLDLCRFLAAVLVVVSHLAPYGVLAADPAHWWLNLGRESVVLFFVLSGFVIAYTTERKDASLRSYFIARATRIYSVALPVLLLGFAVAGLLVLSGLAPLEWHYQIAKPWIYLPLHLFFLGELWNLNEAPPMLGPYWSLGYEVWYYVLFGAAFYLRGRRRIALLAALLLLAGPKLWLLLPVWCAGVWLWHWQKAHALARPLAVAGWWTTLVLLVVFKTSGLDVTLRHAAIAAWPFPGLPLKNADRFLADYLVCVLVVLNFLCARGIGFVALQRIEQPLRRLASYTFTLYLVHTLVILVWKALHPGRTDAGGVALLAGLIVLVTWLVGQLTERRKASWQRLFARLSARRQGAAGRS